ncbi:MAG: hypothetical protein JKY70_17670 [Mucilaginibacter sp.]|nr:hypothetical protein [Mucilaginibacter sp.]
MESEKPFFCFPIVYGGEAVICKVVMQEQEYDIYFDDEMMATLTVTDGGEWIQFSGVLLPKSIIGEIGNNIEDQYE